jgi:hypothetical protein
MVSLPDGGHPVWVVWKNARELPRQELHKSAFPQQRSDKSASENVGNFHGAPLPSPGCSLRVIPHADLSKTEWHQGFINTFQGDIWSEREEHNPVLVKSLKQLT